MMVGQQWAAACVSERTARVHDTARCDIDDEKRL